MNEPTHYYIKNWREFQHYKDRNPPWIKLHFGLISSEDWVVWNDSSRVLAIVAMLVASKDDGKVPNNPRYLQRVGYLNSLPDLQPLVDCAFLQVVEIIEPDASNMLASDSKPLANDTECLQSVSNARPEQSRAEQRRVEKIPPKRPKGGEVDPLDPCYAGFSEFWFEYPKKMNKPDSMKAWKQVKAADHRDGIMESIGRFKKWSQWTKDNGKFIPYPASWLRANSWEDVITIDETPEYQNAPDVEESLRQARARMAGLDVG